MTKADECTIFLGCSGAGKSTLFNYLQRVRLHGESIGRGRYKIVFGSDSKKNKTKYSPIGDKATVAETKLPFVRNNNFDCPGFRDPEPLQDIVNAYSIYRVMSQNKKLKVVLVSSVPELDSGKKEDFLGLLDQIGEIYQDNIDALCDGLCLVITTATADDTDNNYYKNFFRTMFKEQSEKRHREKSSRITILDFLSNTDRIAFFKMPDKEGPIPTDDRETIDKMLQRIPYQEDIKPKLSLSNTSKAFLDGLLSYIFEEMVEVVIELNKKYPELYENFVKLNRDKKAAELRKTLQVIPDLLENVSKRTSRFYKSAKNVSKILMFLSHKDREIFGEFVEILIFFNTVGLGVEINREIEKFRIFREMEDFRKDAKRYVAEPKIECEGNIVKIKGGLLGFSDISEAKLENLGHSNPKIILKSSGILVDEDLGTIVGRPGPTPLDLVLGKNTPLRAKVLQALKTGLTFNTSHGELKMLPGEEEKYVLSTKDRMFISNRLLFDSKAPTIAKIAAVITFPIRGAIALFLSPIVRRLSAKDVPIEKLKSLKKHDETSESQFQSDDEDSVETSESQIQYEESIEEFESQFQSEDEESVEEPESQSDDEKSTDES